MDFTIIKNKNGHFVFSEEQIQFIIEMQTQNEKSTVAIGKMFNVSHKTITKVLEKNHIPRIGVGRRKYKLDESYFDHIDTPEKAQILGCLFADGSNNIKKQTVSMSLQEEDGYILEQMRQCVQSEKPLEYIDYSNKHDFGYHYKNQYRILFFSKHICTALNNLGMVQNKSLKLKFPKISKQLYKDFILGYFDGDGSFCPHYTRTNKFQPLLTFTSTYDFCKELQSILINELGISGGNVYDASCHNGVTSVLSISGTKQTKTILDWLYQDSPMFLNRKYDKYINAFYNDDNK